MAGTIIWGRHSHHATITKEITIFWCLCEPLGLLLGSHIRPLGASACIKCGSAVLPLPLRIL